MTHSETLGNLFAALSAAQSEITFAAKDSTGQVGQQKTRYADLTSVWEACRGPLTRNKLSVVQLPAADGNKVTVTTILGHASGEWFSESLTVIARDASPQAVGSAITYARRYMLAPMVGVTADDDDGLAAQSHAPQHAPGRQSAPQPANIATPQPTAVSQRIDGLRADRIGAMAAKLNLDPEAFSRRLEAKYGVTKLSLLTEPQANEVQATLQGKLNAPKAAGAVPPPMGDYVRSTAAQLVAQGLATPGELEDTLDGLFGDTYGPPDSYPEEIRADVREACREFERGR